MIVLSTQKVMQLHQFLMQETGGLDGNLTKKFKALVSHFN